MTEYLANATYTPTTEEVRKLYANHRWTVSARADFDRWLVEHDRQVAEQAWDEGRHSVGPTTNPYRTKGTEQ